MRRIAVRRRPHLDQLLNAFINKVNALVNSRRMNTITAEVMTTNAHALIDQITTP